MNHHTLFTLWLYFLGGQALHVLKLAKADKAGAIKHFQASWLNALIRVSLCGFLFALWLNNPEIITKLLSLTGLSLDFTLAANGATAFGFGIAADSLLDIIRDKFSFAKQLIPEEETESAQAAGQAK